VVVVDARSCLCRGKGGAWPGDV